jgi:hypothetical protein
VIKKELAPSLEEIGKTRLAGGSLEYIVLLDADHRQTAALGGECVARMRGFLFFHAHFLDGRFPLLV